MAGVPYDPPPSCEDALAFSQRMQELDQAVANILNHKHDQMVDRVNHDRKVREPFTLGTKVWVYKPSKIGGYRLDSRWWGPAVITNRVGEASYEVSWEGGREQLVHLDDLKLYVEPPFDEEGEVLEYTQGEEEEPDADLGDNDLGEDLDQGYEEVPQEVWEADKFINHRVSPAGSFELLVKWKGREEPTWEGANIASQYIHLWVEYCVNSGLAPENVPAGSPQNI